MNRIAVIGAGSWGTALAHHLGGLGHPVRLWCRGADAAAAINRDHRNPRYLTHLAISRNVTATADLAEAIAAGPDLLLWVVPAQATRQVFAQAAPHIAPGVPVVSATKGIETGSFALMSEIFEALLPAARERTAVLSGPSFAEEVVRGDPTAVTVAAWHVPMAERVQFMFGSTAFRVYTNDDPVGTQIGGAIKNVMAIAAGVAEGLGFGHNTQAVLVTRALAEVTRFGVAMGGHPHTFPGLSGLGDLVLTCTGGLSRNRRVGVELGQGRPLGAVLGDMRMVAEGVKTAEAAYHLALKKGVEMPIVTQVYRVLFEGVTPRAALAALLERPPRAEGGV